MTNISPKNFSKLTKNSNVSKANRFSRDRVGEFDVEEFAKFESFEINFSKRYINICRSKIKNRLFDANTKVCNYCRKLYMKCDLKLSKEEFRRNDLVIRKFLDHIKQLEINLNKILIRGAGTRIRDRKCVKNKMKIQNSLDKKSNTESSKIKLKSNKKVNSLQDKNSAIIQPLIQNAIQTCDPYQPFANRYLFVGNLKNNCTPVKLKEKFSIYGQILKLNIELGESNINAVIEYFKISSTVEAIKSLNGKKCLNISNDKLQLDFCENIITNCITIHNIDRSIDFEIIRKQCCTFSGYHKFEIDNHDRTCLAYYDNLEQAKQAISFLKGLYMISRQLEVDFASMDCINAFCKNLNPDKQLISRNQNQILALSTTTMTTSDSNSPNNNQIDHQTIDQIDNEILKIDNFASLTDFIFQQDEESQNENLTSSKAVMHGLNDNGTKVSLNNSRINNYLTVDTPKDNKKSELNCLEPEQIILEPIYNPPCTKNSRKSLDKERKDRNQLNSTSDGFFHSKKIKRTILNELVKANLDPYKQAIHKMKYQNHSRIIRITNPYFVSSKDKAFDQNKNIIMIE